jgi:hypothetical protein
MAIFNSYVSLPEGKYDDNSIRFFGVPYFWTYPGRNIQKDVEFFVFCYHLVMTNIAMENPQINGGLDSWENHLFREMGHRTTMANCECHNLRVHHIKSH